MQCCGSTHQWMPSEWEFFHKIENPRSEAIRIVGWLEKDAFKMPHLLRNLEHLHAI